MAKVAETATRARVKNMDLLKITDFQINCYVNRVTRLYSIYANDLPLYASDADIVQYADDTQVLVSGRPGDIGSLVASI